MRKFVEPNDFGFVRLADSARLPEQAYEQAAGFDLFSIEDMVIQPGRRATIRTGVGVNLPTGFVGWVCSKSGLAAKSGISVLNSPGVIDSDYQGELLAILQNEGQYPFAVQFGDKVAQLVVTQYFGATPKWTTFTHATARGAQGLGSTGK